MYPLRKLKILQYWPIPKRMANFEKYKCLNSMQWNLQTEVSQDSLWVETRKQSPPPPRPPNPRLPMVKNFMSCSSYLTQDHAQKRFKLEETLSCYFHTMWCQRNSQERNHVYVADGDDGHVRMSGRLRDAGWWQTAPGTEQGFQKCSYLLRWKAKAYAPHHHIYEKQMKKHMLGRTWKCQ